MRKSWKAKNTQCTTYTFPIKLHNKLIKRESDVQKYTQKCTQLKAKFK